MSQRARGLYEGQDRLHPGWSFRGVRVPRVPLRYGPTLRVGPNLSSETQLPLDQESGILSWPSSLLGGERGKPVVDLAKGGRRGVPLMPMLDGSSSRLAIASTRSHLGDPGGSVRLSWSRSISTVFLVAGRRGTAPGREFGLRGSFHRQDPIEATYAATGCWPQDFVRIRIATADDGFVVDSDLVSVLRSDHLGAAC
jgi:hypothetical protein